ncbi:MAG TPA: hypothetical protein VGJ05_10230 [Fimbriiglobus sp.]|jgi:hypothetical protein
MSAADDSVIALAPVNTTVAVHTTPLSSDVARRRADVDDKQSLLAGLIADLQCEAVILLLPSHVAWFTSGLNVRGLIADAERPGIYTNGMQRWLLCSNVDTYRLFHEELDGLGFQLKEWQWKTGRPTLLGELVVGRKVAVDRPYPNLPPVNERLRLPLRTLTPYEQDQYLSLGGVLVHAVEATARTFERLDSEEEIAGQVAHRLCHHGAEGVGISVTADGRGSRCRRAGYTSAAVSEGCVIQATAVRGGLYATCSRTVSFGPQSVAMKAEHDLACKVAAVYKSLSRPEETLATAGAAGGWLLANTPYEYDWRHSQPGYGAGRHPAEELRRYNSDEAFIVGQALVWQARIGTAAVVDTVIVSAAGPIPVTPPELWPFKRIRLKNAAYDIPDVLIRE